MMMKVDQLEMKRRQERDGRNSHIGAITAYAWEFALDESECTAEHFLLMLLGLFLNDDATDDDDKTDNLCLMK